MPFGLVRDRWNCLVPTVVPELNTRPSKAEIRDLVSFRNGFAWRNRDGHLMEAAKFFSCEYTIELLIDYAGCYVFSADSPCNS